MSENLYPSRRAVIAAIPAVIGAPSLMAAARAVADPDAELLLLGAKLEKAVVYCNSAAPPGIDYPDDFVWTDDIVAEQIAGVQARSLTGLKVKVRALFHAMGIREDLWNSPDLWEHSYTDDCLTLSIMKDILAMENLNA